MESQPTKSSMFGTVHAFCQHGYYFSLDFLR
jgi:hypothetical protein